jgi:predicted XRE-type DNA-binding protein
MDDPVAVALEEVKQSIQRNIEVGQLVIERADALLSAHQAGKSWSQIVREEDRPLIVELLTANLNRLMSAGGQLRRAKAKALHDDGMTMEQIASFFGVTRQRVSALLSDRSSDDNSVEGSIDLTV